MKRLYKRTLTEKLLKKKIAEAFQENIYFQDHFSRHNPFPKTQLQTTMNKIPSKADMKGKGKAPAVQPKGI